MPEGREHDVRNTRRRRTEGSGQAGEGRRRGTADRPEKSHKLVVAAPERPESLDALWDICLSDNDLQILGLLPPV